ncbi:MAG: hypothetical protein H7Y09_06320 [Chitinophagaceae bacterium]|nr:hypothetical protein [Anaerolineae bacterium]
MKPIRPDYNLIVHTQHHVNEIHQQMEAIRLIKSAAPRTSSLKVVASYFANLKTRLSAPRIKIAPAPQEVAATQEMLRVTQ